MTKAYIVVEWDFYYTDEFLAALGPGFPQAIFTDPRKAQAHAEELNAKRFAGLNLSDYCGLLEEISELSENELIPRLAALTGDDYSDLIDHTVTYPAHLPEEKRENHYDPSIAIPADLPETKLREIASLFTLKFYKVIEFEVTEFGAAEMEALEPEYFQMSLFEP